jgi:tetratricopeptide (TPR) repeat protein
MLAQHKLTKQRHEVMFKGIAFMHRYLTLRRGSVSSPVMRVVHACLRSSDHAADVTTACSSGSSSSSTATRPAREEALTAAQMHELSLYQETLYNLGRAFHDMKLLHLACEQYTRALEIAEVYAYLRDDDSAVTRQAAHNLVQIYKRSGAKDMALEVMQQFLTM